MKQAIHFGAGNIGRGFIGSILFQSGYFVTFVDIDKKIIDTLHTNQQYQVKVVGDTEKIHTVTNIDGLLSTDNKVANKIAEAEVITCAVGPNVLPIIAKTILQGIIARQHQSNTSMLYIIACENMIRASSALKKFVLQDVDISLQNYIDANVAFLDSAVDRIVPITEIDDNLTVTVEEFFEWCVEDKEIKQDFARIEQVHYVSDLEPYIERKLFSLNTAHTYTAWLGYILGYGTVQECMKDPSIKKHVLAICKETSKVLIQKHSFDEQTQQNYIESIISRFENKYINDGIDRIGRAPIRKLSLKERFIAPLQLALEYGSEHQELLIACACGLKFYHETDKESVEIQERLLSMSPQEVFMSISGISDIKIAQEIESIYNNIKTYIQ